MDGTERFIVHLAGFRRSSDTKRKFHISLKAATLQRRPCGSNECWLCSSIIGACASTVAAHGPLDELHEKQLKTATGGWRCILCARWTFGC